MTPIYLSLACLLLSSGVWSRSVQPREPFTSSLMKELGKKGGNVVVSPISIETAMGVIGYGAQGTTQQQIYTTLGYPHLGRENLVVKQVLINETEGEGAEWESANRVMAALDLHLNSDYVTNVKQVFNAEVDNFDFSNPAKTAEEVNTWVAQQTHQVIKKLLDPQDVSSKTRIMIMNAVYFKGEWKTGFNKTKTTKNCFFPAPQQCVEVDTMHNEAHFKYTDSAQIRAEIIELPYKNENYSMVMVLPNEGYSLDDFVQALDVTKVLDLIDQAKTVKVDVSIPKFQVEFKQEMKKTLKNIGMKDVFSEDADLSGMVTGEKITIDGIIHKAKITCDEEGTVAAAATTTHRGMLSNGGYTDEFSADRPFLYLVRNKLAGVFFSGTYVKP